MTAPSAKLAPRNHLVGGNPIRPMTTIITAIISPATPPPTGILLMFMPGCASSAVCARFTALPLLQMYLFAAARVVGTVVVGLPYIGPRPPARADQVKNLLRRSRKVTGSMREVES